MLTKLRSLGTGLRSIWQKLRSFVRGWWYTRTQTDPEIVAKALGRPDKLELTDEQANKIAEIFVGYYISGTNKEAIKVAGLDPAETAREFYNFYPRSDFRYFMAPDPNGQALQFTKPDYNYEAVELIYAAMRKLGAIVVKEDGEYFENAHPLVQRFAEIASKQTIPQRKTGGILG